MTTAIPYAKGGVQAAIGTPQQVSVPPAIFRCRLTGLLFDTNKTFLLPLAFRGMKVLKKLFQAHSDLAILVNGHTDRVGGPSANLKLSEERAKSIEAFLKDDADFWMQFYSGRPGSSVWGATEDNKMVAALGFASVKDFQQKQAISPANGTANAATRKKLVQRYMAEDGAPLPKGAKLETHGCGEFHNEVPTDDGVAEPKNRRVELFLFDPEIGPRPRPTCPSPDGCDEYEEWKKQTVLTVDLDQPMGSLSVRVADKEGKPIAEANVHLSGPLPDDAKTNEEGVAVFADVIPATYRVIADKQGFKTGSAEVVVPPDEGGGASGGGGSGGGGASSEVVLQAGTGDLTVVVTNAKTGKGIAGALVDLLETPDGPKKGLKTDASGNLSLPGTTAGDYKVSVGASGFDPVSTQTVKVGANTNAGVAFKLTATILFGSLTVVVKDPTATAVAGATVDLATPTGPKNGLKTDASGNVTLDPAPEGSYTVTVTKAGFAKSTTTKSVLPSTNSAHEVTLERAKGKLTAVVKDAGGDPIAEATVSITDLGLNANTDAKGLVDFGEVVTGEHTVRAEKQGFGADAKKAGPVDVKTTVAAGANNVAELKMTSVPSAFAISKLTAPKVIAPGAETAKITWTVEDEKGVLAKGKLELLDAKGKVLTSRDLTADERKVGPHELAWKGQTLGAEAPPELPGGFLTCELSPYKVRISGATADGKQTTQQEATVEVTVAEITLVLGSKALVTDARDQRLFDTLGGKIPAAGSTQRIELLSNLFKTADGEMNASSDASFVQYRDHATYGYGDGPRIPLVAKVTFNASDGKKLLAPKAWGKRRLLWDWAEVPENTGALSGKVKTFVENARNFDANATKPKGKLTHKDRGGKRSANGSPAVFEKAGAIDLAAGTKRVWAAFTKPVDGGTDDGITGVLFRPGRQSGDSWKVSVHFEPDPAKDLDVETDPKAKLSKETGTFEVWRRVQVIKYVKKKSGIGGVTAANIQSRYYDAAFLKLDFPAATKAMNDAGEADYNTKLAAEAAVNFTNQIVRDSWIDPAVDQFAAGDHAVDFRSFADFKATLIAKQRDALVAGGASVAAATTQATTQVNNALNTEHLNSEVEHATQACKIEGNNIALGVVKHYASSDDGITLAQFKNDCNLTAKSTWIWFGFAPTYPTLGRTKSALVLYGATATSGTNDDETVGHEIGHLVFLVHSPAPTSGPNKPDGSDAAAHDAADTGPCLMSYDHSKPHHFCGLCVLRLRGWDHTKLDKDGSKNKK